MTTARRALLLAAATAMGLWTYALAAGYNSASLLTLVAALAFIVAASPGHRIAVASLCLIVVSGFFLWDAAARDVADAFTWLVLSACFVLGIIGLCRRWVIARRSPNERPTPARTHWDGGNHA